MRRFDEFIVQNLIWQGPLPDCRLKQKYAEKLVDDRVCTLNLFNPMPVNPACRPEWGRNHWQQIARFDWD
jgi:hypothetical protein